MEKEKEEVIEIDLKALFKYLITKIWIIAVASVLTAVCFFSYVNFIVEQKYQSYVKVYVNTGLTFGEISVAGISASKSLVDTYVEILNTNDSLNSVKNHAIEKDVSVSTIDNEDLWEMITTEDVNDTEILKVTVTDTNAQRANIIADAILVTLKERVKEIITDTDSVTIVDNATEPEAVSKGLVKYTVVGGLAGCLISIIVLFIMFITDQKIHDESYLVDNYKIPLLAVIPDLTCSYGTKYGKYSKYGKYGKYGKYNKYGYSKYYSANKESVEDKKDGTI